MRQLVKAVTTQKQRIYLYKLLHFARSRWLSMSEGAKRKSPDDFEKPYRLHLACGNVGLPGYVNVDVMQTLGVDVVDDIRFVSDSRAILPARSMPAMSWSVSVIRKSSRS